MTVGWKNRRLHARANKWVWKANVRFVLNAHCIEYLEVFNSLNSYIYKLDNSNIYVNDTYLNNWDFPYEKSWISHMRNV